MDGSPRRKESVQTRTLREQYTKFINSDAALVEARRWIERATFTPFKNDDFRESLADGVLLCELIVNVANISVGRINKQGTAHAGRDNLSVFFRACEALGLDKYQLFEHEDLDEVPIKRGQSAADRAKEAQKRLSKVALTIYWLGKYCREQLHFTGRLILDEACFTHLLKGDFPTLPDLEPTLIRQASSPQLQSGYKPQCEVIEQEGGGLSGKEKVLIEKVDFSVKRQAFRQLEEQARQEEQEALQRRKSFSGKENEYVAEIKRRKSFGSSYKTVFKEGDCKFKHKREILGGCRDPIRARQERIVQSGVETETESSPKPPVAMPMHAQVNLREKKSQFEQLERQASEEAEVLQGKRFRPKSWAGGDFKLRGGSLRDRTSKYEEMQYQADKESAVLHGELRMPAVSDNKKSKSPVLRHSRVNLKDKQSKFEQLDKTAEQETAVLHGMHRQDSTEMYDIGDKPSTVVPLPQGAEVKLQDKRRQFETLDYKAQRESSILKLHSSGKSFDSSANSIPLSTSTRRAESKPRPKSEAFNYLRYQDDGIEKSVTPSVATTRVESGREFMDSGAHSPARSLSPAPPSRGYSPVNVIRRQHDNKETKERPKSEQYSSFAAAAASENKENAKAAELNYKDFVVPPTIKQTERVDRYNAALVELSKDPEPKAVVDPTGVPPRRKSRTSTEWIKVTSTSTKQSSNADRPIKKLWDRDPMPDSDDESKPVPRYGKPSVDVSTNSQEPNIKDMRYKDFVVPPLKAKDELPVSRAVHRDVESEPRTNEPFKRFTAPVVEPSRGGKATTLSYKDFVVPPPKTANTIADQPSQSPTEKKSTAVPVRKRSVRDISQLFTELEKGDNKPKPTGPPPPKSLVDREELVRYERESRARSWYGGALGMDDEDYDGAYRRRVRRWSDYEDEERARPRSYANDTSYEPSEEVFESTKPVSPPAGYVSAAVAEVKPSVTQSVESRGYSPKNDTSTAQPVSLIPKHEPLHDVSRPIRSILKNEPASPPSNKPESLYHQADARPVSPEPENQYNHYYQTRPVSPPSKEPETRYYQEDTRPASPPAKEPETRYFQSETKPVESLPPPQSHQRTFEPLKPAPEPEPPSRPPLPSYRAISGRSWQDFESSRRKKSMELLNRPPSRTFETPAEPAKVEVVKLRRPADYIPKHHGSQELLNERPTSPTYRAKPQTYETHVQPMQSQPIQSEPQQAEEKSAYYYEKNSRPEEKSRPVNGLPVTYPTYYQPEEFTPEAKRNREFTPEETGKPLYVNAKLRDNVNGPYEPLQRRSPSQEFIAEKRAEEVQSHPRSVSPGEQTPKLEINDYKFRPRSPLQHTWQPGKDAYRKQPAKEPEVKEFAPRPRTPDSTREFTSSKTDHSPQVFAIVGQGQTVRPVASEVPKPVAVSIVQQTPTSYQKRHEETSVPGSAVKQAVNDVSLLMEEKYQDGRMAKPRAHERDEQRKPKTFELSEDSPQEREEIHNVAIYETKEQPRKVEITSTTNTNREETIHEDKRPAAKVFDFRSQSPLVGEREEKQPSPQITRKIVQEAPSERAQSPRDYRHSEEKRGPSPRNMRAASPRDHTTEKQIVVESIVPVEKEPVPEVDVLSALDRNAEEERLRDAAYREKLRKEVEESNRRQREEARYLMDQMQVSYGSEEDVPVEHKERYSKGQDVPLHQANDPLIDELEDFKHGRRDEQKEIQTYEVKVEKRGGTVFEDERRTQGWYKQDIPQPECEQEPVSRQQYVKVESVPQEEPRPRQDFSREDAIQSHEGPKEEPRQGTERRREPSLRHDDRHEDRRSEGRPEDYERRDEERRREAERKGERPREEFERKSERSSQRSQRSLREGERYYEERREESHDERRMDMSYREEDQRRGVRGGPRDERGPRRDERPRDDSDRGRRDYDPRRPHDIRPDGDRRGDRPRDELDRKGYRPRDEYDRRGERPRDEYDRRGKRPRDEYDRRGERPRDEYDRRGERPRDEYDRRGPRDDQREERPRRDDERREERPPRPRSGMDRRDERPRPDIDRRDERLRHEADRRGDRHDERRPMPERKDDRRDRRYDDRRPEHDRRDEKQREPERADERRMRVDDTRDPRDVGMRDGRSIDRKDDRRRFDDINGNYYPNDERRGQVNGIAPVEERREYRGKFDREELDQEEVRLRQSKKEIITVQQHEQVSIEAPSRTLEESRKMSRGDEWTRIRAGSDYSIYETFVHGDRNVTCASCSQPIRKSMAVYVSELKRYWHDDCFSCVVCHVRFGTAEQRSPLKITDSLLHCENCFITDEGEQYTEL
ncbi:titin homolog isoform X2 [Nematostella vectensis]|uniref:titin homolog isoform X2 n=1 Tax=Nematostella vectensis TaxID=45351 RepID=UPI0020771362|nr:titin homolog isoform X2 [Nematostella vectensis]